MIKAQTHLGTSGQLAFYMEEAKDPEGSFLVINKENGELASLVLDGTRDTPDVLYTIERARACVEAPEPPSEKCYPVQPMGKSGNEVIHKLCTFCDFKEKCFKDANDGKGLIPHRYSKETVWFSKLLREPRSNKSDSTGNNDANSGEELPTESSEDSGGIAASSIFEPT